MTTLTKQNTQSQQGTRRTFDVIVIGSGIDLVTDYGEETATTSITQQCIDNAPEGKGAVIEQDVQGNITCSYQ